MNCPSRNDDLDWTPGWNQNPPFLSADLTTRQDLNGIVNMRELRRGSCYPSDKSLDNDFQSSLDRSSRGSSPLSLNGWFWWLLSVFCTSLFLSNIKMFASLNFRSILGNFGRSAMAAETGQPSAQLMTRSTCTAGGVGKKEYNTSLHVVALFVILFVSTTGCAFPMLVLKFPKLRVSARFLFGVRHFGTGVLIATAFVHLLPTAFISLGNPCLSSFWTEKYQAMPGAIALAAIFLLAVVEMVFSPGRSICGGGHGNMEAVSRGPHGHSQHETSKKPDHEIIRTSRPRLATVVDGSSPLRDLGPLYGRSASFSRTLVRMGEHIEELDQREQIVLTRNLGLTQKNQGASTDDDVLEDAESNQNHQSSSVLTAEQAHKKAMLQCVLLEIGILFHSVFIGMSLSVSTGNEFLILWIAIIFHQTFEGLALGARIAALKWEKNALQPWVMAFTYGCTTPIGQALGLATHTLYSPDSEVGLLVVGIMNAISSGLLVFASLVELLSEDFLSDESWHTLRGQRRVWACILVFLGAALMSLVGAWA